MYRHTWTDCVTDLLLERITCAAGIDDPSALDEHRSLIVSIMERVGGLPFTDAPLGVAERTGLAVECLHDTVRRVQALIHGPTADGGFRLDSARSSNLEKRVVAVRRVPVNRAPAQQISRDLGVSAALGRRVVEERLSGGPFGSLDDLDDRVSGVGPATRAEIEHAVAIDRPADLVDARAGRSGDFDSDLADLAARQEGERPVDRLIAALQMMAVEAVARPHPSVKNRRIRTLQGAEPPHGHSADWVGILFGSDYYSRLPAILDSARRTVDVCMFHIALPEPDHPTQRLLDTLARAHGRGVAVRVLLDRDRPEEPFRSTVINGPAKDFMDAAGVDCRFDREERLLHSKFVVIDEELVVIGSHNWSAGSYFHFDDLSVVVASEEFASTVTTRFQALWMGG